MTLANAVGVLRALATIPIVWAITADQRVAALAIFALAALSDALDGWLARRGRTGTPLGTFIDPMADKVLILGTLAALAAVGRGWPVTVVAVLAILREGVVAVARTRTFMRGVAFPADGVAKIKTIGEIVGVALIVVGDRPWAVLGTGIVGVVLCVGFATLPRYLKGQLN